MRDLREMRNRGLRRRCENHGERAPNSIQVQTLDHVVYLNGLVSDGMDSQTAEAIAQQVPNVSRVVNSVAVSH